MRRLFHLKFRYLHADSAKRFIHIFLGAAAISCGQGGMHCVDVFRAIGDYAVAAVGMGALHIHKHACAPCIDRRGNLCGAAGFAPQQITLALIAMAFTAVRAMWSRLPGIDYCRHGRGNALISAARIGYNWQGAAVHACVGARRRLGKLPQPTGA